MPNKQTIIISVLAHGVFLTLFMVGLGGHEGPRQPKAPILTTELKLAEAPPVPKPELAVPEPGVDKTPPEPVSPIEYAGAPQTPPEPNKPLLAEPKDERPLDSMVADQEPSVQERQPVKPRPVPSESDLALAAEHLKEQGVKAPALDLEGVGVAELEAIAAAGQGKVIVRCENKDFAVRGPLGQPNDLTPLVGRQGSWLSDRAIPIPQGRCQEVRQRLLWQYSYRRDQVAAARTFLSLSNRLDQLLFHRQEEAARNKRVDLAAVCRTTGRLVWEHGKVVDFQVTHVELKRAGMAAPRAPAMPLAVAPGVEAQRPTSSR